MQKNLEIAIYFIAISFILVNGAIGTVQGLEMDADNPVAVVKFDGKEEEFCVGRVEASFERGGALITRKQFPLVPAYAVTIHKYILFKKIKF